MTYDLAIHGREWRTQVDPIWNPHADPDPTRQVLGVLATSVLTDVPAVVVPDEEPPVCTYRVMADDREVSAGDIVTVRRGEPIYRHTPMGPPRFDELLTRRLLRPCDPCDPSASASGSTSGAASGADGRAPRRRASPLRTIPLRLA